MRGQVRIYQKKIVARKRKLVLFQSLYSLLFLGLVMCGLSLLSQLGRMSINEIVVRGNVRLSAAAVESIVLEETAGNFGKLFSRRNSLLYPQESIEDGLNALPLVKEASVSRGEFDSLIVDVTEREESAKWCAVDSDACYSLDEKGLIFARVRNSATSSEGITYKGGVEGDPIGKQFLAEPDFKKIRFFMQQLDGLSVGPRIASIAESGYMTIELAGGGRIMVNTTDDLSAILGNIALVIMDKSVAPSFPEFLRTLDYLKFDAGNKVVYKKK